MAEKIINNIKLPNGEVCKIGGASGFELFDTILKDHILTYEQSKGWALQGTYVYKEAVAGSRYGYPDFYNKCVEEKDLGVAMVTILGENTLTLYTNANGHIFYDIADKEAIDAWYSTYGIAWMYGIDKENERVFLPRTKWFIQPSGEITEVNTVNEAGLPNITGGFSAYDYGNGNPTKAFKTEYRNSSNTVSGGNTIGKWVQYNFNASDSNPIYGNSTTVQPPSINQLLYICVGNTNVESAVTDVVDVTTTENDTVPLFTGMYFDFTPNNVSWLKAGEQANSGGIYAFTYNELVNILNGETKYGDLKVINVADMVAGEDYSLYWKVNQEDMYFITPTAISNKALSGGVMGNGMTLGLTDGANNYGLVQSGGTTTRVDTAKDNYGSPVGSVLSGSSGTGSTSYGITTDPTKSGIIVEQSTSQLYFKVANAVQNLELLDAGEVMEAVNNVVPDNSDLITGFICPDWDNAITFDYNTTTFTAPQNGYFGVTSSPLKSDEGSDLRVFINGIQIIHFGSQVASWNRWASGFYAVSKGDVITQNDNSNPGPEFIFVPMKGAK